MARNERSVAKVNAQQPRQSIAHYREGVLETFYDALKMAGIDFVVFLPDSLLDGLEQMILQRKEIETFQCAREDEGIGMAMGAFLVGKKPIVMMEGSGIGLAALILARGVVQRTPSLLLIGHNSTLGERFDHHSATRLVAEPVLRELAIPRYVIHDPSEISTVVVEAQRTVEGQRMPVGILVPPYIIREF
jgi:sulfopyruvate decarboxylase TPP-binding subunit